MRFWNQLFHGHATDAPRRCEMESLEERQFMSVTYASMAATPMALAAARTTKSVIHFKPQAAASSGPLDGTYSGSYNGTISVRDSDGNTITSPFNGKIDATISGDGTSCKFNIPILGKHNALKPSVATKFSTITVSGKTKTKISTAIVGGKPDDDASGTITVTGNKLTFSGNVDLGYTQATVNVSATKK
jgi:hypothetical protein